MGLAVACIGSCRGSEAEQPSTLAFGDALGFEQPAGEPGRPWGGGGTGGAYERLITCGDAPEGECTGTLASGEGPLAEDAFASMTQCVPDAEPLAGRRVRLSALLATEGVDGFAGVWLRVDRSDRDGPPLAFDNMASQQLDGTSAWQRHEVTVAVPDEATGGACFGFLLSGSGRVEADAFKFETIG